MKVVESIGAGIFIIAIIIGIFAGITWLGQNTSGYTIVVILIVIAIIIASIMYYEAKFTDKHKD